MKLSLACQLLVATLWLVVAAGEDVRYPIILVPGLGGSQLDAIHDHDVHYPFYCQNMSTWRRVWIRLSDILPYRLKNCLIADLLLYFSATTGEYNSHPGVRVRPHGFGTTDGIEYLDPSLPPKLFTKYYGAFVDFLVNKFGYKRNETLFGAPFDWRLSPWHTNFPEQLKELVEMVSSCNDDKPVIIVSHSMGGPVMQNFFTYVEQQWKDQFIRTYVSIEGAFLGAAEVIKAIVSGSAFHLPLPDHDLNRVERSFESLLFLLPDRMSWPEHRQAVLITPEKNYTVFDYERLLTDLNISHPAQRLRQLEKGWSQMGVPRVPTYCLYGHGTKTPMGYYYKSLDDTSPSSTIWGDGDGTVPLHSLTACKSWQQWQTQPVHLKGFDNVQHVQALRSQKIFKYFAKILATL